LVVRNEQPVAFASKKSHPPKSNEIADEEWNRFFRKPAFFAV
jgi:hypothetical protein